MAKRSFQALDGSEIKKILLTRLEDKLATVDHPQVTADVRALILKACKKNLDLDQRFELHVCYPVISLDLMVALWPDDPAPYPWAVRFDLTTPQNLPVDWSVEERGTSFIPPPPKEATPPVAVRETAAVPLKHPSELKPGKPSSAPVRPADPSDTLVGDDLRERKVNTQTHAGLELETQSEPSPFGPGEAPPEDREGIAEERRQLERRNAKILAEAEAREKAGGIVLTDAVDEGAPDAIRRAHGLAVPETKTVQISGGSRESSLRQTVDRTIEEAAGGTTVKAPTVEEVESL